MGIDRNKAAWTAGDELTFSTWRWCVYDGRRGSGSDLEVGRLDDRVQDKCRTALALTPCAVAAMGDEWWCKNGVGDGYPDARRS